MSSRLILKDAMEDRDFTELELRAMLERAESYRPSVVAARWIIRTRHRGAEWAVIVEPDSSDTKGSGVIYQVHAIRDKPSHSLPSIRSKYATICSAAFPSHSGGIAHFPTVLPSVARELTGCSGLFGLSGLFGRAGGIRFMDRRCYTDSNRFNASSVLTTHVPSDNR